MKEGAIIHLVLASFISFAPPQAAGLIHSAARPLPTRSFDLAGTPCVLALCETRIPSLKMTVFYGFAGKSQGYALRRLTGYPIQMDGTCYPVPLEVIYYRVPSFFYIHPAEK